MAAQTVGLEGGAWFVAELMVMPPVETKLQVSAAVVEEQVARPEWTGPQALVAGVAGPAVAAVAGQKGRQGRPKA